MTDHPAATIEDLSEFLKTFHPDAEGHRMLCGEYFYDFKPGFRDFNRDLVEAGANEHAPDGGVAIMADWDFWMLAFVPLRFRHMRCEDVVEAIWPGLKGAVFHPDTGDHWWTAKSDDGMEVPGEPFELWIDVAYEDRRRESMRLDTYKDVDSASESGGRIEPSPRLSWEIRQWKSGRREPVPSVSGQSLES